MAYKNNKLKQPESKTEREQRNNRSSKFSQDKKDQHHHKSSYLDTLDTKSQKQLEVQKLINLTNEMQQIINEGYQIFRHYSPPEHFSVCPCCVSMEEEAALRTFPLVALPRKLLYSYNTSAKTYLTNQNEVAYLLPRILELTALDEEIHHSQELNLIWLAQVPNNLWLKEETDFLERFALVYFKNIVEKELKEETLIPLDVILIMFARVRINIEPILAFMAENSNIYLILSLVNLLAETKNKDRIFTNPFARDCPELDEIFYRWFERDKNKLKERASELILNYGKLADQSFGHYEYAIEEVLCDLSEGKWFF